MEHFKLIEKHAEKLGVARTAGAVASALQKLRL
jgi:hypothetical protein